MRTLGIAVAIAILLACSFGTGYGGEPGQLAAAIMKDSGWNAGICVDAGRDPKLGIALAKGSRIDVYRVERDTASVARTRKLVEAAGLSPLRVRVEVGPLEKLAYPDHCANLIIAPGATKEVLRLLRPAGGVAYLSGGGSAGKGFKAGRGPGGLGRLERLPLAGADDWTHNGYSPGNNRYSLDTNIRAPFRIKWYGNPRRSLGGLWAVRGLAAGGRYFMADRSLEHPDRAYLVAKDAYNGTTLWEREAGGPRFNWFKPVKGEGPSWMNAMNEPGKVHTTQIIITGGKIYLTDSTRLMVIDAAGGKDLPAITAPSPCHPKNHWSYVAHADGKLFGHAATAYEAPYTKTRFWPRKVVRSKEGGPAAVFALDLKSGGKKLWVRGGAGDKELGEDFSQPLAIGAGRVFVRSGKDLYALDAASGKTKWVARGIDTDKETFWNGTVVGKKLHLYRYSKRFYGRRAALPWPVFSTEDGKKLGEERPSRNPMKAFFSSARKTCRMPSSNCGCPLGSGAGKVMFERNSYYMEGGGSRNYGSYRAGCRVPALPANGVVHLLPAYGCRCRIFSATITLDPGRADEKMPGAPAPRLEKGGAVPNGTDATAADWPTWRGNPARTAITGQDLSGGMKKLWEAKTSGELTAPIAVGDLVFFGSTDETVRALDARTGKPRWTFYATGPVSSAPVYAKGRIYFGSHDGWVYCLSANDGKLAWRLRLAPFARKQSAFARLISAWPVRQGLAVDGGVVYATCGRVPDQGVVTYAIDAAGGKTLWNAPHRRIIPGSSIVVGADRIFVPTEVHSKFLQLSKNDGKVIKSNPNAGPFEHMSLVKGSAADDGKLRKGFVVHGSSFVGRGHPKIKPPGGFTHNLYAAPWTSRPHYRTRESYTNVFSDGGTLLPLFGEKRVFFRRKGKLVGVDRSKMAALRATKPAGRGARSFPREKFLAWSVGDLPCGEPKWAALAKGTLLVGGPQGVTAVNIADGKPRWSVALKTSTQDPAISRGRVFLTSETGKVYCLAR